MPIKLLKGDKINVKYFCLIFNNFFKKKIKKKIFADDPEPTSDTMMICNQSSNNTLDVTPSSFVFNNEKANKYEANNEI